MVFFCGATAAPRHGPRTQAEVLEDAAHRDREAHGAAHVEPVARRGRGRAEHAGVVSSTIAQARGHPAAAWTMSSASYPSNPRARPRRAAPEPVVVGVATRAVDDVERIGVPRARRAVRAAPVRQEPVEQDHRPFGASIGT